MKETHYFYVPQARQLTALPAEEAAHAVRVLRMAEGDEMVLMDGQGTFYRAVVTLASNHHCAYRITEQMAQPHLWQGKIHLAIAPTKLNDRMEWMAEKAVEVGLDQLTFLNCQFSERRCLKTERIRKIVVAAVKQSRKAYMPVVDELTPFSRFIECHSDGHRYIAHCYDEVPRTNLFNHLSTLDVGDDALVMIGPEGDFSVDEVRAAVDAGFISVDLGPSRLRTETAGLAAVMMMQLAKQRH